jgi:putative ABC transport system permease protein
MLPEWLTAIRLRVRTLFRRRQLERDLDDELQFHLDMHQQKLVEQGMPPEEARYAARRAFGNSTRTKETSRDMWTFTFLETLWQDVRYGLRQLRRNPGFTIVAVLTLALGIGVNTAIFSVIDGVFLRPLPYPNPDQLVYPLWVGNNGSEDSIGSADYLFWKEHTRAFESSGAYEPVSGSNLVVGQQPHYVKVTKVSPGMFSTLGVNPILGREFTQEEGRLNGPHAVILSYHLWKSFFPTAAQAIGRTVRMNGQTYTVAGVMPRGFQFVAAADVYTPLQLAFNPNNHDQNYGMVARLRPGVTVQQAQADVDRVFNLFKEMYPEATWKGWRGLRLISYRQELTGNVRAPLMVLFWAVSLVLLIAIFNVTSLFLGRSSSRRTEMALRTAIGASRWRVLRQLVTEGLLLAALGGCLGFLFAAWGLGWLLALIPQTVSIDLKTSLLPLGGQVKLDSVVLIYTLVVSVLAGFACGVFGAFQTGGRNLFEELKQNGRTTASRFVHPRVRHILVTAEVAVSIILLAGAGLMTKSFLKLRTVNPGFDPQAVSALEMSLPPQRYPTTAEAWALQQRILERLENLPGVTGVATTSNLPVTRGLNYPFNVPGCGSFTVQLRAVSSNYFRVMGIPLLAGREFLDTDQANVAIINSKLAQSCWAAQSAVGMTVGKTQVVGVVGNTKEGAIDNPALPVVYLPQWLVSDGFTRAVHGWFLAAWVIRSRTPLDVNVVRQAADAVDPTLPIANFKPMTKLISTSFAVTKTRLLAGLLDAFTGLALLLALIGIYGVLSYLVTQRTHEIGIRMALGAERRDVLRMVIGQGLKLALVGVVIGVASALALTRFLSSLLYGVKPTDPLTFVAVSLILIAVALVACYIPARRASKVDPMVALRYE